MSAIIHEIKARVSLLDVARDIVPELEQRGPDDFWACCPFHAEDTPSFHVRPREGYFICFGCGERGDVISLQMKARGLAFREALRVLKARAGGTARLAAPRHDAPSREAPSFPSPYELADLLTGTTAVSVDATVAAWLRLRGLDPVAIESRISLARALPLSAAPPPWAIIGRRSWPRAGYQLIVPMFAPGSWDPVSVRARQIGECGDGTPKSVAPRGHTVRGAVMADQLGRWLLADGRLPADWPAGEQLRVIVGEGEPDFLTLATHWADKHPSPAVFGVVSGAWTSEVAACIPNGALVEVRTDQDAAGDRLADVVNVTLAQRCEVYRVRPPEAHP